MSLKREFLILRNTLIVIAALAVPFVLFLLAIMWNIKVTIMTLLFLTIYGVVRLNTRKFKKEKDPLPEEAAKKEVESLIDSFKSLIDSSK